MSEKFITVFVFSPNHTQPTRFEWDPGLTVGEAALAAAKEFRLQVGETKPTLQNSDGEVLDTGVTLAEAGVCNSDRFELVTSGGGV